jgi:hypothetical protein
MRAKILATAVLCAAVSNALPAHAARLDWPDLGGGGDFRPGWSHHWHARRDAGVSHHVRWSWHWHARRAGTAPHGPHVVRYGARYAGRDAKPVGAWCGWYMRRLLGVADRAFNLAANWAHWGRPSAPRAGAVVVWPHHVGIIRGGPDASGRWLIESGNDGNTVRTRRRSLAGAIAFRM